MNEPKPERITEAEMAQWEGRSLGPLVVDRLVADWRRLRALIVDEYEAALDDLDSPGVQTVAFLDEAKAIRAERMRITNVSIVPSTPSLPPANWKLLP